MPEDFHPRCVPIAHPLNSTEILIMGGKCSNSINGQSAKSLNDAFLLNTISEKCSISSAKWVTGLTSGSNAAALTHDDKVVSLVYDSVAKKSALIQFSKQNDN